MELVMELELGLGLVELELELVVKVWEMEWAEQVLDLELV